MLVYLEDGRVVIESRSHSPGALAGRTRRSHSPVALAGRSSPVALAGRTRRDVAAAWFGEGSVVEELIAQRRAEAAREEQS